MKSINEVSEFKSRWVIRGTLTTCGPLHVGDGGELEIQKRKRPADKSKNGDGGEHDASTVCTDWKGRACIPGSSIKGVLRARVKAAKVWDPTWAKLLGSDSDTADKPDAEGGKVEFSDALLPEMVQPLKFAARQFAGKESHTVAAGYELSGEPPYWLSGRFTGVAVSVSLDRRTRTAKEKLLYHLEYVPAGVPFEFELTGENLKDDEVARLLALLDTFNDKIKNATGDEDENPSPVTLGGQASNTWGRVEWKPTEVCRFSIGDLEKNLPNWLAGTSEPDSGYALCKPLGNAELAGIEKIKSPLPAPANLLTINLRLHFPGPLLVRDPQQGERGNQANGVPQEQKPPDGTPVLDEYGFPVIPAKAVRGVLRARAEMILRTLKHEIPEPSQVKPVSEVGDLKEENGRMVSADPKREKWAVNLDPASKIFGASGWGAPLETGAFRFVAEKDKEGNEVKPQYLWQEFVAIDRFTGGAAEKKKFNARSVVGAAFKGSLTLDLGRLKICGADGYALGILALVLRDLAEGDLTFGSKAAIGYGACETTFVIDRTDVSFSEWAAKHSAQEQVNNLRLLPPWKPQVTPSRDSTTNQGASHD